MRFKAVVACERPLVTAWKDGLGTTIGADRPAVSFVAAYAAPTTQAGSRIVDGALRETTVTKPTLYIDRRDENAAALVPGAIASGDPVTVDGKDGWQVDGDPGDFQNPLSGREYPLVVELRRAAG